MKIKWFIETVCLLLIILFIYTATNKLVAHETFKFQLMGHKLLLKYIPIVAIAVPAVEIIISLMLIFPRTKLAGLYASAILLLVFTAYIVYMFNFYPTTPCSCGGIISKLSWKGHIIFNVVFMLLALIAARLTKKQETRDRVFSVS